MKNQVKLSPDILWVDEIMVGSTINRYMLRRWNEKISLAICRVDGKTTIIQYSMDWGEDDGIKISISIWKGKLKFISSLVWKGRDGAWEGGLRSRINKYKRLRNDDKKKIFAELRHERGLYPQTFYLWNPSQRCTIGWYCWSSFI